MKQQHTGKNKMPENSQLFTSSHL